MLISLIFLERLKRDKHTSRLQPFKDVERLEILPRLLDDKRRGSDLDGRVLASRFSPDRLDRLRVVLLKPPYALFEHQRRLILRYSPKNSAACGNGKRSFNPHAFAASLTETDRISAGDKFKAAYPDQDNRGQFSLVIIADTEDEEEFRIILNRDENGVEVHPRYWSDLQKQ